MDFLLFTLTTASLFLRPAEILPETAQWPIYEILILSCLLVSVGGVATQLTAPALAQRPITVCVLGMLAAIVLSHASHGDTYYAREAGTGFLKVVIYYLLLGAVVNTPQRFRVFLGWLVGLTSVMTGLALLQYHHYIDISALKVLHEGYYDPDSGTLELLPRLLSTGIFNDPNDLSMVLVLGMAISASWLFNPGSGIGRASALATLPMFAYALALTRSRGGLLAFLAALLVLLHARYGWRKTVVPAAVALPLILYLFAGRQTDITTSEGTSQQRIQFWAEGMMLFRQAPLFGIGTGQFEEEIQHVAHNSYVQSYTELGFFGGTIFFAAFAYAIFSLYRLGRPDVVVRDRELLGMRPFLLSALVGYAVGMASLSRSDVVPTYLVLGLANAYIGFMQPSPPLPFSQLSWPLVRRYTLASAVFFVLMYVFVRVFARFV